MRYCVVAVYDSCAEIFARPAFVANVASAVRSFAQEVGRSDPENALASHPEHFGLYELGVYDDGTGLFETLPSPRLVVTAVSVRPQKAVQAGQLEIPETREVR